MEALLLVLRVLFAVVAAAAFAWLIGVVERPSWLTTRRLVLALAVAFPLAVAGEVVRAGLEDPPPPPTTTTTTTAPISELVGGCPVFQVYGQNQFEPYGTAVREAPHPSARQVSSFAPNEIIAVDGWVVSQPAYPTNPEPWNSGVWYHVADNSGWVSFPGVRAYPSGHVDDDLGGYAPAPVDPACAGSIRS